MEIENKLRHEADEMQDLLRERHWYRRYVDKIAAEAAESSKLREQIVAKQIVESKGEGTDDEMDRVMQETIRQQQAIDKAVVVAVAPPSCHYKTLV